MSLLLKALPMFEHSEIDEKRFVDVLITESV